MEVSSRKIRIKQSVMIVIAFLLFLVGIPNITSGLSVLPLLENMSVDSSLVWRSLMISTGFGLLFCIGGAVLLFKSYSVGKMIHHGNESIILIGMAIFLVTLPWFQGLELSSNSEMTVDGITTSGIIVMALALIFSLITWGLFSWASKKFSPVGIYLAIISGASLTIPFIQSLGPMAAIPIGITAGFVGFMLQKRTQYKEANKSILISVVTLFAAYLTLGILIVASQSIHLWDTGNGIGSWSGTPEGIEETDLRNSIVQNIQMGYFMAIIPSLMITVMTLRAGNEN